MHEGDELRHVTFTLGLIPPPLDRPAGIDASFLPRPPLGKNTRQQPKSLCHALSLVIVERRVKYQSLKRLIPRPAPEPERINNTGCQAAMTS